MPYNPALDDKLKALFSDLPFVERKKMFGGTAYMLHGNFLTGVYKDLLVIRVGRDKEEELRTYPWCRPMDITGKPMKGWLFVEAEAWDNAAMLQDLLNAASEFVQTLPKK